MCDAHMTPTRQASKSSRCELDEFRLDEVLRTSGGSSRTRKKYEEERRIIGGGGAAKKELSKPSSFGSMGFSSSRRTDVSDRQGCGGPEEDASSGPKLCMKSWCTGG